MKQQLTNSIPLTRNVILAISLLSTTGCAAARATSVHSVVLADEVVASVKPVAEVTPPRLRYEAFPVEGPTSYAILKARYGEEGTATILKLNRIDRRHLTKGQTLLVPAEYDARISPFPAHLEGARAIPKILLVSLEAQAFAAYESGNLVRWGPISSGKKATPTPAGLYFTNWRAKLRRSSVDENWLLPWYFNIDDRLGLGIHQYDLPGYAASHGCVRMMEDDARWVFDWADAWKLSKENGSVAANGTPVIVFGAYAYGKQAPWKRLIDDDAAGHVSRETVEMMLSQYLASIEKRSKGPESKIA